VAIREEIIHREEQAMDKMPDLDDNDLSQVFALNHIFHLVNYKEFEDYLSKNKIKMTSDLFEGYLFFIKTISRGLLDIVSLSPSFHIESNLTFERAMNRGIPLEKIKNNCQKVVFLKNIYAQLQIVWKSTDSKTLEANMANIQNNVLKTIDHILQNNVELSETYTKFGTDKVIRRLAINYALVYLNDTRHHGTPLGYFFSLSSKRFIEEQYASKVFNGYKLTLCFLWQKLLSEEDIQSSELIDEIANAKNWDELDETFETARILEAELEKEFRLVFGFEKYFKVVKPINASLWNKNLFEKVPEPMLSKEQDLQQELLWYPVQAMSGMTFNGVSAFARLLIGDVWLKRALDNPDKTIIARFVHPLEHGTAEKHDYSYAIVVDAFATLADYSGWLVFYDCCGDYSGFAGGEHQFAEMIIKQYLPHLEVKNVTISKKEFLEYLEAYSGNFSDDYETTSMKIPVDGEVKKQKELLKSLSLTSTVKHQQTIIEAFKGYLLELLAYYYMAEKPIIRWRYRNQKLLGDDEIDVIARDSNKTLFLVSCMSTYEGAKIEKLNAQSKLIEASKNLFIKEFGEYENIRKIVFLPEDPTKAQSEESIKHNVALFSLKRLLNEDSRFSSLKKTDIVRLFSTNRNDDDDNGNNPSPEFWWANRKRKRSNNSKGNSKHEVV
jgi:hypothetical protein